MNILKWFVRCLNGIIVLIVLCVIFLWATNYIDINTFAIYVTKINTVIGRVMVILAALVIFILNFFTITSFLRFSRYETRLLTKTGEGEFSVAIFALEEGLEKTAKSLPEIADIRVKVLRPKSKKTGKTKGATYVKAICNVWRESYSSDLKHKLISVLKEKFNQIVETEENPVYQIHIASFVEKPKVSSKKHSSKEKSSEPEFRGPEWPVG